MIKLRVTVFNRIWFGLQDSIVEKLLGIVIFETISELLDLRNINDSARSAEGAVI